MDAVELEHWLRKALRAARAEACALYPEGPLRDAYLRAADGVVREVATRLLPRGYVILEE